MSTLGHIEDLSDISAANDIRNYDIMIMMLYYQLLSMLSKRLSKWL